MNVHYRVGVLVPVSHHLSCIHSSHIYQLWWFQVKKNPAIQVYMEYCSPVSTFFNLRHSIRINQATLNLNLIIMDYTLLQSSISNKNDSSVCKIFLCISNLSPNIGNQTMTCWDTVKNFFQDILNHNNFRTLPTNANPINNIIIIIL